MRSRPAPSWNGADSNRDLQIRARPELFFCRMGHVDEEIRFERKRSVNVTAVTFARMERDFFSRVPGRPYLPLYPRYITGTAHPETVCSLFSPFPPEDNGLKVETCNRIPERIHSISPPSRKSAQPNVPDRIMPVTGRPHPGDIFFRDAAERSRCLRPSGGATMLTRSPVLPQSMAIVSPKCVWASKKAGQIQTWGAREVSSTAAIRPFSITMSTCQARAPRPPAPDREDL